MPPFAFYEVNEMRRKWIVLLALALLFCTLPLAARAEGLAFDGHASSLNVKSSLTLRVLLDGKTVRAREFIWQSSDPEVASVSTDGRVRALKAGTVTIAAVAADSRRAECELTVLQPVTGLKAPASRMTLEAGKTSVFSVAVLPENASNPALSYASSNEKVAIVDENGVIHALKAGRTTLTARSVNGVRVRVSLTVTQPVTRLELSEAVFVLDVGRRLTLQPSILPADATDRALSYSSADPEIASVSSRGRVSAQKPGETTVTVRAPSGATASCVLRVVQPVRSVRAEASRVLLNAGEEKTLVWSVLPEDATDPSLSFISSNPSVLSVDALSGRMTSLRAGSAYVTARSVNGKSARVRVTVEQPVLSLCLSEQSLTLERGRSLRLSPQIEPADATDRRLAYHSSDTRVATVSSSGSISAKKAGEAIITVAARSGATAQVRVTVTQPVTRIDFGYSRRTIGRNETVSLTPSVLPADATDPSLFWASSDPEVASVAPDGELTGRAVGTAVITARAGNGKKDSFRVTVKEIPATGLLLERLYLSLTHGQRVSLGAQVLPQNATEQQLAFSSSRPDVVFVDEQGAVSALCEGEATLTVCVAADPSLSRTCTVVVRTQTVQRLTGVTIGLNAGHQIRTNATPIPVAPGSKQTVSSIKTGSAGVVSRVPEYEVNLQVALRLQKLLEAEGARVVMVRTTNDVNLSNIERANLMNDAQCDLALQIHCNGSQNRSLKGFSIYARQTGVCSQRSQELAQQMHPILLEITGAKNAGCYTSERYASLNWSTVPSVLLEMGYLSNPDEDRMLTDPDYQTILAQAICESLCACLSKQQ